MKWRVFLSFFLLLLLTQATATSQTSQEFTKSYGYIPALYHCFCSDTVRVVDTVNCLPESLDYEYCLGEKCTKKFGTVEKAWKDFKGPEFRFRTDTINGHVVTSVELDIRFDNTLQSKIARKFIQMNSQSYKEYGLALMYAFFPIYMLPELDCFPGIEVIYQPNLDPVQIKSGAEIFKPNDTTITK